MKFRREVDLIAYIPKIEDLWFREALLSDPETMSYNAAWGGTIPFPKEKWKDWFGWWIGNHDGNRRFYRYLLEENSNKFVGEIAYHIDREKGIYLANIIIFAKYRGKGYGKKGLSLLLQAAKENGCLEIYDAIAADNPSIKMFLDMGFVIEYETKDIIMVRKIL